MILKGFPRIYLGEFRRKPSLVPHDLFDLGADPAALDAAAAAVRALGSTLYSARDTVDRAADEVEADGSWGGDTADMFQHHRRKLTGDLELAGSEASRIAVAVETCAEVLRHGQARLDEQKAKLSTGSAAELSGLLFGKVLVFVPKNEAEAVLIHEAISTARDIRRRVDTQLDSQEGVLRRAVNGSTHTGQRGIDNNIGLRVVSQTWQPQQVKLLTYNVGQGTGNTPFNTAGTDPGDIDEVGQIIAGSGANVITLQEMFHVDATRLEQWLNQNTGGEWELQFDKTERKLQFDGDKQPSLKPSGLSGLIPVGDNDFGNAILVRKDDLGEAVQHKPTELQRPGYNLPGMVEGRVLQHTEIVP